MMRRSERGAALPLITLALAMMLVSVLMVSAVGERTVARTRAQSAADASALAGVAGGSDAASRLAEHNDGTLVSFSQAANEVTVVVVVDGVRAVARAERHLTPPSPSDSGSDQS